MCAQAGLAGSGYVKGVGVNGKTRQWFVGEVSEAIVAESVWA